MRAAIEGGNNFAKPSMLFHLQPEYNAADVIVMTLIRCVALLYSYHQFRTLSKMGSKYILGKCSDAAFIHQCYTA
jgi:hypothetical protein